MGVADRGYMRDRGPPPIAIGTSWTLRLFVLLAVAFLIHVACRGYEWFPDDGKLLLSWPGFRAGRVWTIVTAALLHDGVWHLAYNLLGFWYCGKLVEETLGSAKFVAFFWLAAALSHVPFLVASAVSG